VKRFNLTDMTRGWFVGDFHPTALRTEAAEVAVKRYEAGTLETRHFHKLAPEVTLILEGRARINEHIFNSGDIVVIAPGEAAEFEALTAVTTVVVKTPSAAGDKYEC
jgi:quercetin dioxygenase-like cupin family protein